jgi:hypothetical protein
LAACSSEQRRLAFLFVCKRKKEKKKSCEKQLQNKREREERTEREVRLVGYLSGHGVCAKVNSRGLGDRSVVVWLLNTGLGSPGDSFAIGNDRAHQSAAQKKIKKSEQHRRGKKGREIARE